MSRRRAVAPNPDFTAADLVYPFTQDDTLQGRLARIEGRRGWYRIAWQETNAKGSTWLVVFGPGQVVQGRFVTEQAEGWLHVRPEAATLETDAQRARRERALKEV